MTLPRNQPRPSTIPWASPYPAGREKFIRIREGAHLHYSLELHPDLHGGTLELQGNFPEGTVRIEDQGTTYPSFSFEKVPPGQYHFRGCLNKGSQRGMMDPQGYTHVMVDPLGVDNMRLYTFIPNISGTIDDWIEELDRIAEMGFNLVHLLPITPMDHSQSPYSAASFYGVDERYLRPGGATLDDFVAKAQQLKLGLCFDLVLNHIGITSEIATECPDWIQADPQREDGLKRAGCWHGDGWLTWDDLALIDYNHPNRETRQAIWEYMFDVLLHWSSIAESTGGMIRLDNLHSTNSDFLRWAMPKLQATLPQLIVLGELFASPEDQNKMVLEQGLHLLLATPWDKHYVPDLRNQVRYLHEVYPRLKFILPISSHDSGTPTQEFFDVRATLPRYAVSTLLSSGATGMCQGVEYGAPKKLQFIGFQGKVPIEGPRGFHEEIQSLNNVMDAYPVLRQGGNLTFIDGGHGAILGAYRHSHDSECPHMVILINLDLHHEQSIVLTADNASLFANDQLKNIYGYHRGTIHDLPSTVKMTPCSVRVLEVSRI